MTSKVKRVRGKVMPMASLLIQLRPLRQYPMPAKMLLLPKQKAEHSVSFKMADMGNTALGAVSPNDQFLGLLRNALGNEVYRPCEDVKFPARQKR